MASLVSAGKTTFEDIVINSLGANIFGYKLSTVDFVKEIAKQCGWDGAKTARDRKFLSDLKQLLTNWNDVPLNKMKEAVNAIRTKFVQFELDPNIPTIFIDCREPQEIEKLKQTFNAKTIFIRRDSQVELSNSSDRNVENYIYDIYIDNSGTLEELIDKAKEFMKKENIHL